MNGPVLAVRTLAGRLIAPTRYRSPRDVAGLLAAAGLLGVALIAVAIAHRAVLGPDARVFSPFGPGQARTALAGIAQVAVCATLAGIALAAAIQRSITPLAGLAMAPGISAAGTTAILALAGDGTPHALAVNLADQSWLAGAAFPDPALIAAVIAACAVAAPWLGPGWRGAIWVAALTTAVARVLSATVLPMELAIAVAAGALAGLAVRVTTGVPDRRPGSGEIASALASSGLPVASVHPAGVQAKGSRPFIAVADDGRRLFIKALGVDQRYADLLYRAYRAVRLKNVGDVRPATSRRHAVEHQALIAMLAERAGVRVPPVHRIITAPDGTALLVMDLVPGSSLDLLETRLITDKLLRLVWTQAAILHRADIAHRSLRAANVMVDTDARPWLVDFSFAEHSASRRQQDVDIAELLASLAILVGPDRSVAAALEVIGAERVAAAMPLLQPQALSAATRRAIGAHRGLLAQTRSAAVAGSNADDVLASVQRVRPRTLLGIAAAAGAFYFVLPQLAHAAGSWKAVLAADWRWLPAVIAASALTYVASALALAGSVASRLRFWPTLATQAASSFINRVSPANVGGMALNVRFLQRSGVEPAAGVAAVGVNAFAGAVIHLAMIAVFFALAGRRLARAFSLPSGSKLLLILAAIAALTGLVLATRRGRRFAASKIVPGLRSSVANLRQVGTRPPKIALLLGGSALVTVAYIAALAASVQAFGGGVGLAEIGAVYLGAAAIAAASPTPGGLGAIEAALIAGLTGIGMRPGAAVAAVLTYRLATYWLPIAPGWAALHLLQRRGLI